MDLPEDYIDLLSDELAPFGFEFLAVQDDPEGGTAVSFETEPDWFVRNFPGTDIERSYRRSWPPERLTLQITIDRGDDVTDVSFETYDLMLWANSEDHKLAGRLGSLADPIDHAAAVGEALGRILEPAPYSEDDDLA
ncbi:MAG: hypothetical protein IPO80_04125 [Propionibacteriaceae bacterium]|nr:hypothetical protein [Propionibacteriaceae bacterium]